MWVRFNLFCMLSNFYQIDSHDFIFIFCNFIFCIGKATLMLYQVWIKNNAPLIYLWLFLWWLSKLFQLYSLLSVEYLIKFEVFCPISSTHVSSEHGSKNGHLETMCWKEIANAKDMHTNSEFVRKMAMIHIF